MTEETAPVAPQRFGTRVRSIHGDHFDDPWDWLRQRDNPDVIAHVHAENQWAEQVCKPAQELAKNLVSEFDSFTAPDFLRVKVCVGGPFDFAVGSAFHAGPHAFAGGCVS